MREGVPSHDTFGRVFSILSPDAFQAAFISWAKGLATDRDGRVIAIDGKTLRRSHDRGRGRSPIHLVNAWRSDVGLALGQRATDDKSNEITAVPELLDQLYLKGAIVALDAMGCQREIATTIRRKEADYVLAVKGNQPSVRDAVQAAFDDVFAGDEPPTELHACMDADRGHGRSVERAVWVLPAPPSLRDDGRWPDLASIVTHQPSTEASVTSTRDPPNWRSRWLDGRSATKRMRGRACARWRRAGSCVRRGPGAMASTPGR